MDRVGYGHAHALTDDWTAKDDGKKDLVFLSPAKKELMDR